MRVATIDVGTNTVLLLVADVGADGELHPAIERETITRLGQGVDRSRELDDAAVERTLACLEQLAREISTARCERVAIVGTSALRDARGGDDFRRRASAIVGAEVRVLSGDEEAEATFLGATSDERSPGERVVFDIGGGSTEIVVGDGATGSISFATSVDIGSVRLTERFLHHDPPSRTELDALRGAIADALRSLPLITSALPPIGVAGTMTTLASVALGLSAYDAERIHGTVISTETLESALRAMEAMRLEQRRRLVGMVAARADVIVAGGAIAIAVLHAFGAANVIVSDRGVRWGVARWLTRQGLPGTI